MSVRQQTEAIAADDGLAHGVGVDGEKAPSAADRLLDARGEQGGVQTATTVLLQGGATPQTGEVAVGVVVGPTGAGGCIVDIGHVHAEQAGNLQVSAQSPLNPIDRRW